MSLTSFLCLPLNGFKYDREIESGGGVKERISHVRKNLCKREKDHMSVKD